MTPDAVRRLLRAECIKAGSQMAFAKQAGVSLSFVNDVLMARRSPGPSICSALGLERIVGYRKIKG